MAARPRVHPIQIVEIWTAQAHSNRRARRDSDPSTMTAYIPRARLVGRAEDGRSFSISVSARIRVPVADDQIWIGSVRLAATLISEVEVSEEDAAAFARLSGVFLMWPYARVYLGQMGGIAGVTVPPLPLLTRPGSVTAPGGRD
jgi:hypothetical protein